MAQISGFSIFRQRVFRLAAMGVVLLMVGPVWASSTGVPPLPVINREHPLPSSVQPQQPQPQNDRIALREAPDVSVSATKGGEKIQIEAEDQDTGQTVNIEISSNALTYDPEDKTYTVTGEVYIIIPEKETEILADKVVFHTDNANMVATGRVFLIQGEQVLGSEKARFDFKQNVSYYDELRTVGEFFRLRGQKGVRTEYLTVLKNGRILLKPEAITKFGGAYARRGVRLGQGAVFANYTARRKNLLLSGDIGNLAVDDQDDVYILDDSILSPDQTAADQEELLIKDKPISPYDVATADYVGDNSPYQVKTRKIKVYRKSDGFDTIVFDNTTMRYKGVPLWYFPKLEFGYIEDKKFLTYLGTDFGYNVDYGGVYLGPGWDFRFLDGWIRYSPIISYGGGRRLRAHRGEPTMVDPQIGYGFLGHYRSPTNVTDFGYGTTLREPIFLSEQQLFGRRRTRLRLGANQYYSNGFFGIERPRLISEVADLRQFQLTPLWRLRTYLSAGVAKDDFFPTRDRRFFVAPKSPEPIVTSRLQLQGQLRSTQPLLYLGQWGAVGALMQGRFSWYGTGDTYSIVQAGPYFNLVTGPLFSQVRYTYSQVFGQSPFVFDSYYRGRNNLLTVNSLDIGKYITVGVTNSFNLNQDNAKNALLVDQKLFISLGPKHMKFSIAFDPIQKRSFFGITVTPHEGAVKTDFDELNIYEPDYRRHMNELNNLLEPPLMP